MRWRPLIKLSVSYGVSTAKLLIFHILVQRFLLRSLNLIQFDKLILQTSNWSYAHLIMKLHQLFTIFALNTFLKSVHWPSDLKRPGIAGLRTILQMFICLYGSYLVVNCDFIPMKNSSVHRGLLLNRFSFHGSTSSIKSNVRRISGRCRKTNICVMYVYSTAPHSSSTSDKLDKLLRACLGESWLSSCKFGLQFLLLHFSPSFPQ